MLPLYPDIKTTFESSLNGLDMTREEVVVRIAEGEQEMTSFLFFPLPAVFSSLSPWRENNLDLTFVSTKMSVCHVYWTACVFPPPPPKITQQ